jgi:hypothetical protein
VLSDHEPCPSDQKLERRLAVFTAELRDQLDRLLKESDAR